MAAILLALAPAMAAANVAAGVQKWRAGDWAGAVEQWQDPAARGDADAMFNLGQAYRLGRGVAEDRERAQELYRRAAAKGHVAATANLGITLFQDGRRTEALPHLRTAADRGDLRASYVLGLATFSGDGAPRNPALGYAYVLRARDGGLDVADRQAARMATLLSPVERARGEAAATALAEGRPVAVAMTMPVPTAAPVPAQAAAGPDADEDVASEAATVASRAPSRPSPAPRAPTRQPPAADAKAVPQAAEAASGWKVQLGAYSSEQAARTAWATLVAQSADVLRGETPVYSPRAGLVRLQVGPLASRESARSLCQKLSAAGRPCFVTES